MARIITGTLLLLVIGIGVFTVWMRGDSGGVVDLTDDQVAAARASGAASRDIAVNPDEGKRPLPTLAELTVVRRLFTAPRVILLVATIGLAQLAEALLFALPEPSADHNRQDFPTPWAKEFEWFGNTRVVVPANNDYAFE